MFVFLLFTLRKIGVQISLTKNINLNLKNIPIKNIVDVTGIICFYRYVHVYNQNAFVLQERLENESGDKNKKKGNKYCVP